MYRTAVGIDALNAGLQERLNPRGRPALKDRFRVGDRLIQTRNSHELGLMNGSICFLVDDDPDEEAIVLETDDGGSLIVPYDQAGSLKLGYAISVHKAQGSEVPVVVCVCHRSHARMLSRPADLHGDHAREADLRAGRRAPGAGDGGAARRLGTALLGAGRAAAGLTGARTTNAPARGRGVR